MITIFGDARIIPVLTIETLDDAVPLAKAVLRGGLSRLIVTFRTQVAGAALAAIASALPDAVVGAGTLLRAADVSQAKEAGARFLISPGLTPELAAAGLGSELPFIPGVATASEVLTARDLGCSVLNFFPAEGLAGQRSLAGFAPVFRGIAFCASGGIDFENAPAYLRLANVAAIAVDFVAPAPLIAAHDWDAVTRLVSAAAKLV